MPLRGHKHVVYGPAVVEAVRPHTGHAAFGHLFNFVIRHLLPLADDDRIERRIIRAHTGRDIHERHRLMQVVQHLRMKLEEGLHHDFAEVQRHHHGVAIVVVGHVLAPIHQWRRGLRRILFPPPIEVDHHVAAIHFDHGRDHDDGILADVLDAWRLLHGQTIRQFHQHFRRASLGRMNRTIQPIERNALGDELLGIGVGQLAGVCQLGCDLGEAGKFRQIGFIGNQNKAGVAALFTLACDLVTHSRRGLGEFRHVAHDVLDIGQAIGRSDDIAEHLVRAGHRVGHWQVVHHFRQKRGIGGVLFDLRPVSVIHFLRRLSEPTEAGQ